MLNRAYLIFLILFLLIKPGFSLDQTTKDRLAIKDFTSLEGVSPVLGNTLSDYLRNKLVNTKYYFVKTSYEQAIALRELKAQEQKAFECGELECAIAFGQQLEVNRLIYGKLSKTKKSIKLDLFLIDVTFEVNLMHLEFEGNSAKDLQAQLDIATRKINQLAKIDGYISNINDSKLTTTFSKYDPISIGSIIDIYKQNNSIITLIGKAKIIKILENQSIAKITNIEQGYDIELNDLVKIAKEKKSQENLSKVTISVNTSWTSLTLDGEELEKPLMKEESSRLYLEPGRHTLIFSKKGFKSLKDKPYITKILKILPEKNQTCDIFLKNTAKQKFNAWSNISKKAEIILKTEPKNSTVFIDGEEYGNSNTISLMPGNHNIKIRHYLYYDYSLDVDLDFEETVDLGTIKLKPNYGEIEIASMPKDAVIYLDGEEKTRTPYSTKIQSGTYELVLKKYMYNDLKAKIIVKDNQILKQNLKLIPNFGTLQIATNPGTANIYLDDLFMDKTPTNSLNFLIIDKLKSAKHKLTISKKHYKPVTKYILIKDDTKLSLNQKLNPIFGVLNLTTTPKNMHIYLDDKFIGKSPLINYKIDNGKYILQFKDPNNFSFNSTQNIEIQTGKTLSIKKSLKPKLANFSIIALLKNKPISKATVFLDNKKIAAKLPLNIKNYECGKYLLSIDAGEYFLEKPIVIKYKNQNKLQVGLVPKKQKLYISCNKNKADIFINNQRLNNKTPAYIHDLDVGTYNIRIEKTTFKNKYYYNENYYLSPYKKNIISAKLLEDMEYRMKMELIEKNRKKELADKMERAISPYWGFGYRLSSFSLTLADAELNSSIDLKDLKNVNIVKPLQGAYFSYTTAPANNDDSNGYIQYRISVGTLFGLQEEYDVRNSLTRSYLKSGYFAACEGITKFYDFADDFGLYMGFGLELYSVEFRDDLLRKNIVMIPISLGIAFPLVDIEGKVYLTPVAGSFTLKVMSRVYPIDIEHFLNSLFKNKN
jgi:hypothetical protein